MLNPWLNNNFDFILIHISKYVYVFIEWNKRVIIKREKINNTWLILIIQTTAMTILVEGVIMSRAVASLSRLWIEKFCF